MKKVELLAPAGNFEKLEIAVHYGADAVYFGGRDFSLRNFSGNFNTEELEKAVLFCREHRVKSYITVNIYSRNNEQDALSDYIRYLGDLGPDGFIISDPAIIAAALEHAPHVPIHLSTQANTTNYNAARFWKNVGVTRVNAARELSLEEIATLVEKSGVEVEVFVHGAMCMSYSGRCLLSAFLSGRDGNRGRCNHPCRWRYAMVEEKRPGEYIPVVENERGTFLMNSKDLCMINHVPELIASGVVAFKIEGRMKGIHYTATTVKAYREAIDAYYADPETYRTEERWVSELNRAHNREYCTGFFFNDPDEYKPYYKDDKPLIAHVFLAKILDDKGVNGEAGNKTMVRNKIIKGEAVEMLPKTGPAVKDRVLDIRNDKGESQPHAQPNEVVTLVFENTYEADDLVRRAPESQEPL